MGAADKINYMDLDKFMKRAWDPAFLECPKCIHSLTIAESYLKFSKMLQREGILMLGPPLFYCEKCSTTYSVGVDAQHNPVLEKLD